MAIGKHLRIRPNGTDCLQVTLEGNPKKPEPTHFRVAFPGGDVDVARTTDGEYWIHIRVNKKDDGQVVCDGEPIGKITDARLDITGKAAMHADVGDFNDEGLYHLAVRVATTD